MHCIGIIMPRMLSRHALSEDQLAVFDYAVDKFERSEQFLLVVHGPPVTGKTLLANRIMKVANRLGLGSKLVVCPGAAASIDKHYLSFLVFDEVSMLYARLAACIERRWREADILDLIVHSPAYGGRGFFVARKKKRRGTFEFDRTLGFPGEGPQGHESKPAGMCTHTHRRAHRRAHRHTYTHVQACWVAPSKMSRHV